MAVSIAFFLFGGVSCLGIGTPVSLENACMVGLLTSSKIGSLLRIQLMASSMAFLLAALGIMPSGRS